MNQNHLHLHLNVTNAPKFGTIDKSNLSSKRSVKEFATFDKGSKINSFRNKTNTEREKLKLKRNNIQYNPLTTNSAFGNKEYDKPPTLKQRIKTKSNDMSLSSLATCENKSFKPSLITGLNMKSTLESKFEMNRRSISTKNLSNPSSNLKMKSLSHIGRNQIQTYKLDGIKIIFNRLQKKYKSYFDAIVKYADKTKRRTSDSSKFE